MTRKAKKPKTPKQPAEPTSLKIKRIRSDIAYLADVYLALASGADLTTLQTYLTRKIHEAHAKQGDATAWHQLPINSISESS